MAARGSNQAQNSTSSAIGDRSDIVIAGTVLLLVVVVLLYVALSFDPERPSPALVSLLWGTGGASLGWVMGIIVSPYDQTEGKSFSGISRAVYGVIAGYIVAKMDPLISAAFQRASTEGLPITLSINIGIGFTAMLTVAAVTYISRRY